MNFTSLKLIVCLKIFFENFGNEGNNIFNEFKKSNFTLYKLLVTQLRHTKIDLTIDDNRHQGNVLFFVLLDIVCKYALV
jgi:hypothetical protein